MKLPRKISIKQLSFFFGVLALTSIVSFQVGRQYSLEPNSHKSQEIAFSPQPQKQKIKKNSGHSTDIKEDSHTSIDNIYFDSKTALIPLKKLRGSERLNYINDLFTFLATTHSPEETLKIASKLGKDQDYALRILITEWHLADNPLPINQENGFRRRIMALTGGQFGIEVELSQQISQLNFNNEIKQAWLNNLSEHTSRSQIHGIFDSKDITSDPSKLLKTNEKWTQWETDNYRKTIIKNWAKQEPKKVFNWASENTSILGKSYSQEILTLWAKQSPSSLASYINQIEDYEARQAAIQETASSLAFLNTTKAITWADSITDSYEREIAYESIYDNSIKGIGAYIESSNGLPQIKNILKNGPLLNSGIQIGDQIVETIESDGTTHDLYGKNMKDVIGTLAGEPDSFVQLRVLRQNTTGGALEEIIIETKRDLLIIDRLKKL